MERAGAATVVPDSEIGGEAGAERLRAEVAAILGDAGRLETMAAASRALAKPDAARRIADEVLAAANG
jgi:UDP-N-acetylglucosamine--N-acetylmuramyl-(pentapeptide) pyrophosphoryl-undecaprenol N-acetylglucosamine transferase